MKARWFLAAGLFLASGLLPLPPVTSSSPVLDRAQPVLLAAPGPIPDVALGGGRVLISRSTDDGRLQVLSRELERVTSSGAVRLSAPEEITAVEPEDFGGGSVEVSGDYVLTLNSTEGFMLRVGARPAINLSPADPELNRIRQSGRYSLAGGVIYRPAPGHQAREVFRTGTDNTDIFGPKIAWVTATGQVKTLTLNPDGWLGSEPQLSVLARRGAAGPIAVSTRRVAWLGTDKIIHVYDQGTGRTRLVRGSRAQEIRMDAGLLTWVDRKTNRIVLLDVTDPDSKPRLSVLRAPYAVDDGLIAGLDKTGKVRVRAIPFTASRPLLISENVPGSFTKGEIWRPEFEFAGPVKNAELRIGGTMHPVRVIHAQAPRGTLNTLRWNGTRRTGAYVGGSCPDWRLTGIVHTLRGDRPFHQEGNLSVIDPRNGSCGGAS